MGIGGELSSWGVLGRRWRRSSRSRPATRIDGASRDSRLGGVAARVQRSPAVPARRFKPVLQQLRVEPSGSLAAHRRASSSRLRLMRCQIYRCAAQLSRRVTSPRKTQGLADSPQTKQQNRRAQNGPVAASGAMRPSLEWIQGPLWPAVRISIRDMTGFWPSAARRTAEPSGFLGRSGRSLSINY